MGLFDSILEKLGLKKNAEAAKPPAQSPRASGSGAQNFYTPGAKEAANQPAPSRPVQPGGGAIAVVDVVGKLEGMAKKYPMKLNWKESINDLLVLLDLPHGANDLKELAVELKCPANIVDDSFKRNMWLHKAVLKAIADNGGNIPKNLLD
jgi:hypothetical protein